MKMNGGRQAPKKRPGRKNRPGLLLPVAFAAAALTAGAAVCVRVASDRLEREQALLQARDQDLRQTATPQPAPAPRGEAEVFSAAEGEGGAATKIPEEAPRPTPVFVDAEAEADADPRAASTDQAASSETAQSPAAPKDAPRAGSAGRRQKKGLDLSAYDVPARSAGGESLLPENEALSARDLNAQQMKPEKGKPWDGGRGWLGDVYRGAKRMVDSLDEATLDASKKALGSVADPSSAKIRPGGGGVKLHIEIPPETVNLSGKRKAKDAEKDGEAEK